MTTRPRARSVLFGATAVVLLVAIDLWLAWLRRSRRALERSVLSALAMALALAAIISLVALVKITSEINEVVHDTAIGIEATRAMRPLISRLHFQLRTAGEAPIGFNELVAEQKEFDRLFAQFRDGMIKERAGADFGAIQDASVAYFQMARLIAAGGRGDHWVDIAAFDRQQQVLLKFLGDAIDANIKTLRTAADQTSKNTALALRLARWVVVVVVGGGLLVFLLQLATRWVGHKDVVRSS